jgi:ERCC4-related helicase
MTADGTGYAPGAQVEVRDELWLIRNVTPTRLDGQMIEVTGVSPFVRGIDSVFYDLIDEVRVLDPRTTRLVPDDSPNHRRARLYLEAVIRKSFLPQTEHGLALTDNFLMDQQVHQFRPAQLALSMRNLQPRLLIADVVGLGKTLEIGVLLAELIRRGRGERILVVTPQQVLEQFQRELWTRFGIPLVRLDSTGIQRVQQEIPSGRNPFAYFKRVIVSVDTLKDADQFGHYLEKTSWDAVVIDESHNLIRRGSQRNELAQTLAPRTDALILASATPHNGDGKSFAELIRLLDPAAIADTRNYSPDDLDHLYIRRTKATPEVRDSLKSAWADRGPSSPVLASATDQEEAVFAELIAKWIPVSGQSVSTFQLFPYTLLKSFLSSHRALQETIATREKTLQKTLEDRTDPAAAAELAALADLAQLAQRINDSSAAKLSALIAELKGLGVGPGSDTRVVVFSERIPTLKWLAEAVPAELGFVRMHGPERDRSKPWLSYGGVVQVMHAESTSDDEQQKIVERFGLRDDPVRLLFTGDIASEGVNLQHHCHLMIHYDLPWSLIRIEQRNGRIDRYGQTDPPQFRAIILTSAQSWRDDRKLDDTLVGEKLLAREAEAHKLEGSADAVTGLYRAKDEETRLTRDLIAGKSVEVSIRESRQDGAGFLAGLLGQVGVVSAYEEVPRAQVPTLFAGTAEYFDEALRQICRVSPEDELGLRRDPDGTIAFEPPRDLTYRFRALPISYLKEQNIIGTADRAGRIRVTFSKELAAKRLKAARDSADSQWPNVSYLTDVHPVLDWLTDKVLVEVGRHEAPVLNADVDEPVFLIQGIYANAKGRSTIVKWMAVTGLPQTSRVLEMTDVLTAAGVGPEMAGRSVPRDLPALQALVPAAIEAAERWLADRRGEYDQRVAASLAPYRKRLETWKQNTLFAAGKPDTATIAEASARFDLAQTLETTGAPMMRLLAVLEGNR